MYIFSSLVSTFLFLHLNFEKKNSTQNKDMLNIVMCFTYEIQFYDTITHGIVSIDQNAF